MPGEYVRDPGTGLLTAWNGRNGTPERARRRMRRAPSTGLVTAFDGTPDFGDLLSTDASGLLIPPRLGLMGAFYSGSWRIADFANGYFQDGAGNSGNDPSVLGGWSYVGDPIVSQSFEGELKSFATNVPPWLDTGLLMANTRQNLQPYSGDPTQWGSSNANISLSSIKMLDGSSVVAADVANVINNNAFVTTAPFVLANSTTYTRSALVQPILGSNIFAMEWFDGSVTGSVQFNFATGTTSAPATSGMMYVGGGYWLCWVVFTTAAAGVPTARVYYIGNYGPTTTPTVQRILCPQVEPLVGTNGYPGPRIFTAAAAITRAVNRASMAYTLPAAGWLSCDFRAPTGIISGNGRLLSFQSGADCPLYLNNNGLVIGTFNNTSALDCNIPGGKPTPGAVIRAVVTWDATGRAVCVNGSTPVTDANAFTVQTPTALGLGSQLSSDTLHADTTILRVMHGSGRIATGLMQALTA